MRHLSKKTQYCLRALYALSRAYGRGPMLIAELAADEGIPQKFLAQILLSLKAAGLVESTRGRGGGYELARPPDCVTVGSVIRMVEGPLAPLPCASETRFRKCDECDDAETCGTRIVMREVRDAIAKVLDSTTLAMVCGKVDTALERRRLIKLPESGFQAERSPL
jgi:Rrf2 family protein